MRALVFDGEAHLRTDYPIPKPGTGEALVAVHLAGVCRTDLEILRGYMGFAGVMGHEFVGSVVEGPPAWKHKRVVGQINCVCGRCDMCRGGLAAHCRNRTVIGISGRDGVFADFVALPAANLHAVPETLSDEQAVFVEPLAAAFQIPRQITIDTAAELVVLGDGRLGQLVARVLKNLCRRVVLVGRHPAKLLHAEKKGIQTVLAGDFRPRAEAPVVVDATGTASGFELAMKAVRPRGTIVLKSTFAPGGAEDEPGPPLDLAPLVINEVNVVGSRCGPFPDALAALAGGQVEVVDLISKRFSLDSGVAALEAAADGETLKVLIEVGPART
ncbi:MAG TPA: alcohol dehydrogenase catalytic domain-containing protein [Phycisphaerae bacterium]|nr:alcohol dehydrogenase catalytic domain-containing protein [Phycisphaerae bacterium]